VFADGGSIPPASTNSVFKAVLGRLFLYVKTITYVKIESSKVSLDPLKAKLFRGYLWGYLLGFCFTYPQVRFVFI